MHCPFASRLRVDAEPRPTFSPRGMSGCKEYGTVLSRCAAKKLRGASREWSCVYFQCVCAALRSDDLEASLAVAPAEPIRWGRRGWLLLAVFFTYSLAYLDRANYGFGAAAGMAHTLGITGGQN